MTAIAAAVKQRRSVKSAGLAWGSISVVSRFSLQSYDAAIRATLERECRNLRAIIMLAHVSGIIGQKPRESQPSDTQSTPSFDLRARGGREYAVSPAGYFSLHEGDDKVKVRCVN